MMSNIVNDGTDAAAYFSMPSSATAGSEIYNVTVRIVTLIPICDYFKSVPSMHTIFGLSN